MTEHDRSVVAQDIAVTEVEIARVQLERMLLKGRMLKLEAASLQRRQDRIVWKSRSRACGWPAHGRARL